ncbi:NAD(P)H-binding protein [Microbacterium sp.]|uniref:SDR family oxidoreductase n=1 Tax=Microbacterium sp. TaxID=51671 RepID=UPI00333F56A1
MTSGAKTVLMLGATGYIGRHLAAQLHARGHCIRAVVRDRQGAERPGAHDAPALAGLVDEWIIAHDPADADRDGMLMEGVDHVVSTLGVTRQKADPWAVDWGMNLRYLELAEAARPSSFLYVGVMNASLGTSAVARAKHAFMETLRRSRITPLIVNPSGYFSDLTEIHDLARRGMGIGLGDGSVRLSPIHGADLAAYCADRLDGPAGSWDVGGPEALTYREIVDLAFRTIGRRPRYTALPRSLGSSAIWIADRIGPRPSSLTRFFLEGMQCDSVGAPTGTHRLGDYFRSLTDS